jgi:hypothetical protein
VRFRLTRVATGIITITISPRTKIVFWKTCLSTLDKNWVLFTGTERYTSRMEGVGGTSSAGINPHLMGIVVPDTEAHSVHAVPHITQFVLMWTQPISYCEVLVCATFFYQLIYRCVPCNFILILLVETLWVMFFRSRPHLWSTPVRWQKVRTSLRKPQKAISACCAWHGVSLRMRRHLD